MEQINLFDDAFAKFLDRDSTCSSLDIAKLALCYYISESNIIRSLFYDEKLRSWFMYNEECKLWNQTEQYNIMRSVLDPLRKLLISKRLIISSEATKELSVDEYEYLDNRLKVTTRLINVLSYNSQMNNVYRHIRSLCTFESSYQVFHKHQLENTLEEIEKHNIFPGLQANYFSDVNPTDPIIFIILSHIKEELLNNNDILFKHFMSTLKSLIRDLRGPELGYIFITDEEDYQPDSVVLLTRFLYRRILGNSLWTHQVYGERNHKIGKENLLITVQNFGQPIARAHQLDCRNNLLIGTGYTQHIYPPPNNTPEIIIHRNLNLIFIPLLSEMDQSKYRRFEKITDNQHAGDLFYSYLLSAHADQYDTPILPLPNI